MTVHDHRWIELREYTEIGAAYEQEVCADCGAERHRPRDRTNNSMAGEWQHGRRPGEWSQLDVKPSNIC